MLFPTTKIIQHQTLKTLTLTPLLGIKVKHKSTSHIQAADLKNPRFM